MHFLQFAPQRKANGLLLSEFGFDLFMSQLIEAHLLPFIRAKFDDYKTIETFSDVYAKLVHYTVRTHIVLRQVLCLTETRWHRWEKTRIGQCTPMNPS
jgi:hypothetical protein